MRTPTKDTVKIISVSVVIASLCCLLPVILVLFGLSTAAFAGSLANTLDPLHHNSIFEIMRAYEIRHIIQKSP